MGVIVEFYLTQSVLQHCNILLINTGFVSALCYFIEQTVCVLLLNTVRFITVCYFIVGHGLCFSIAIFCCFTQSVMQRRICSLFNTDCNATVYCFIA